MESDEQPSAAPLNRQSILSLVFGILTVMAFCISWLPIPLTGVVCVPLSLLFGVLALVFGVTSLVQIRRQNGSGHHFAWGGILIGGFVFVCSLCMLIALIAVFVFAPGTIPRWPFFNKFF